MNPAVLKKDKLYQELRQGIVSGRYAPGSRLPRELEFSRMLGVAKVTLRSALERLEAEKLIVRLPRKGTFVSGDPTPNLILIVYSRNHVTADFPHHYIIPGICEEASELGFQTEQCFVEYLRDLEVDDAVNILRRKNLRGVLLFGSCWSGNEQELKILHALSCPVLIVNAWKEDIRHGFPLIRPDVRRAWQDGLGYLISKGYRRIKFLVAKQDNRGWSNTELTALCRTSGLEISDSSFYLAELTPDSIAGAVDRMLSDPVLPDAVYCYSDFFAIELMKSLKRRKIRIPEEIAVMGFCGYPGDNFLDPALSTVDFCYADIGRSAVRTLASLPCGKKAEAFLLETPSRLVERESTLMTRKNINQIQEAL